MLQRQPIHIAPKMLKLEKFVLATQI